ncbi:exodeoxyribonuclease V subunit beta [Motilimonas sp. E26]|uniref:exodeoxyribonuclease V subunit beta n=1 Tax=Motilimonas sp. E26 TaxID=2865674 RepID=UPI001E4EA3C8|nr:exodeoxyribonuclease V subunit beta [Motilimonas sp. E26]MCE0559087.1 exodeoxyribonuclease V subunit beta [Motilimonas sp. E26]
MAQQLDAITFPLHGPRLIEASAGTGKTYTIASLVLRLLLGHGDEAARRNAPLTIDQILVVTFTEAATAELRDRIRQRIRQQRQFFIDGIAPDHDPVGQALLRDIPDYQRAAQALQDAERQMDEAAVYTIHGFCQRMLKQHAFESGALFEAELIQDQSHLLYLAVVDYWRIHFYPLDVELSQVIYSIWPDPSALQGDLQNLLSKPNLTVLPPLTDASLAEKHQQIISQIKQVKAAWLEAGSDILDIISDSGVSKRSYSKKNLPNWFVAVTDWAQQDTIDYQVSDKLSKFSQAELFNKTDKGAAPEHPVFTFIEELLSAPLSIKEHALQQGLKWVKARLSQAKQQTNELSFDDLLLNLGAALASPSGQLLATSIGQAYPVAMIDEFQDTDPIQYQIFHHIYGASTDAGWFMIGDPKQAIYGFRGADIFTYIQARREISDHYTLGHNYRSSASMINGVNQVFLHANKPFIYAQDISFQGVSYPEGKPAKQWLFDEQTPPALNIWLSEPEAGLLNKHDYQNQMALTCANQINRLLRASQQGRNYIKDAKGMIKAINAGSIAVLVRTGREAARVKQALSEQGIKSVYLSNRDSVFATPQGVDLYRVLAACLTPTDDRLLRAALSTSLFNYSAIALNKLFEDENAWEQKIAEFVDYHTRWQKQGVLVMIRELLSQQGISARLLGELNGERELTDLLHLAELLQQASFELEGQFALVRWYMEQINNANGNADEQQLRLESDQNLVQIVTIHKSKGLEYDFVFLPFVCNFRAETTALYHDEATGQQYIDLSRAPEHIVAADKERLAEDLRLLYVALTRSVHACYLGLAPLKSRIGKSPISDLHQSAIGYLIQQGQEMDLAGLKQQLTELAQRCPDIAISAPDDIPEPLYEEVKDSQARIAPAIFNGTIETNWWVTSYSALSRLHEHAPLPRKEELPVAVEVEAEEGKNVFSFYKGARAGTFLHTLFENIDFANADRQSLTELILQQLEQEGYEVEWLDVLVEWVEQVLAKDLGQGFALADLTQDKKLVEMEFYLPIAAISASPLNQLLLRFDPLSQQAGALKFNQVQGMLKGFIDLTFEHQGKYYVLDYKSNHLGNQLSDYHQQAMAQGMIAHRYDFQYQLYSLALHRFLRQRIPNYDYDQHFGGVYYLFLRGMQPGGDGVFFTKPDVNFINALDQLFAGEEVLC